jgi:ABC-type multidrug transport system ATPase subunit
MIRVVDVTHHYGVRPILKNISFEVQTGEVVAVVGPNGMGKTTLLGVLAGVLWPHSGFVQIDGIARRESVEGERELRKRIVYLPDRAWLPKLQTGREFILAVGRLYGLDDMRLFDHAERLLRLFDMVDQGNHPIQSYSAGQLKKISLCGALITEAPYLLLDEPFSGGLDPGGILALKRVLQRLAARDDVTIVMTTPVPELVEELADRVAVIMDGRLTAFETPDGLRRLTKTEGPLAEVLERLLHADTLQKIDNYFAKNDSGMPKRE